MEGGFFTMEKKFIYNFSEGDGKRKDLLGSKGANLAEMTHLGLPVPPGFTITTEACAAYWSNNESLPQPLQDDLLSHITSLERTTGKGFGHPENPLLVSVRSGARASMPGMMDTILNLGLNDETAAGLAKITGNPTFAYDSYRRFIQMYADVVKEVPKKHFDQLIPAQSSNPTALIRAFHAAYQSATGEPFPQDPIVQLNAAVCAVFRSWQNPRAITYRRMYNIPNDWGTAVNVQSMVFGNMGNTSATGVLFSRNPATGDPNLYGEFLLNAQGEDVVAGIRTPQPIRDLATTMPDIYAALCTTAKTLESHYKDMQDMEFTVERGTLYMLQTRSGKRTAKAAMKIAVDLVAEGLLSKEQALMKIDPLQIDALLHPQFDKQALDAAHPIAQGLPASPGAAAGKIYFTAADCIQAAPNHPTILVRFETSPEDIEGMQVAKGILTAHGGMTSHAAVVARSMGVCCVSGCADLHIDEHAKTLTINGQALQEGDLLSLDGSTGNVYHGALPTVAASVEGDFCTVMRWADEFRTLRVRANADNPEEAALARYFKAEGIGLTRTEHMFFEPNRIRAMREMILSKTPEQRTRALDKLLPHQQSDFEGIYRAMEGYPVTIRLLDPPLHEFLPTDPNDIDSIAADMALCPKELRQTIAEMQESNPMLGHRGCRLSVTCPEVIVMQTTAIIRAALAVKKSDGLDIIPEIMVPLISTVEEFTYIKAIVTQVANRLIAADNIPLTYLVGTMIEIPRATLTADRIAKQADFFSFGTNDLTQMTYGISRDDTGAFLQAYYNHNIFPHDPFATLDQDGVGKLVELAVTLGRGAKPGLKIGICGEHGGDPSSVAFFHSQRLDYVSCSSFRVPIARLAAAQATLREKGYA